MKASKGRQAEVQAFIGQLALSVRPNVTASVTPAAADGQLVPARSLTNGLLQPGLTGRESSCQHRWAP